MGSEVTDQATLTAELTRVAPAGVIRADGGWKSIEGDGSHIVYGDNSQTWPALTPAQWASALLEEPATCPGVPRPDGPQPCFLDAWAEVYCVVAENDVEIVCPTCNGTGKIDKHPELRAFTESLIRERIENCKLCEGESCVVNDEARHPNDLGNKACPSCSELRSLALSLGIPVA
jgi:hypothetical protein